MTAPPTELDPRTSDALAQMRARDRAAELFAAEKAARTPSETFDAGTVREVLSRAPEPPARIDGLMPWDASTVLIAQRKAGKTTTLLNLADSLLSGDPFLGRFEVRPAEGTVAFLNYEVSAAQLARWADDVGVDPDRLILVNLRGRRNPLGNPTDQTRLATMLRERNVEAIICDPFGRAYTGASQNDAGEVTAWLVNLDHFARSQVGAKDVILAVHAGWDGERGRGSSALEEWPDSIINLVRGKDDDENSRYLKATGRDVDIDEDRLTFDPRTRRLTMSGAGSRKKTAAHNKILQLVPEICAVVGKHPGITATAIAERLRERGVTFQKGAEAKAVANALSTGALRVQQEGRSKHYFLGAFMAISPNDNPHTPPNNTTPENRNPPTHPNTPQPETGTSPIPSL